MRRNENLEELIVAAVEMKVQERMQQLSSTTGSRLKKLEREAFQDKEEIKQMKIMYDRQIAKLTADKDRLEQKLSARMQFIEDYFSTGKKADKANLPDLNANPTGRSSEEPIQETQLQETLDED